MSLWLDFGGLKTPLLFLLRFSTAPYQSRHKLIPAGRLETAKIELEAESEFDVTVVNDSVERAAQEIAHIVGAESAEA